MTDLAAAYATLKTGTLWSSNGRCKGYAVSNPGEAALIDAYVAELAAGVNAAPPVLATATGRGIVSMLAALATSPAPTPSPTPSPEPVPAYLFHDEFDGAAGSPPDPAKWWTTPWCSTSADDAEGCYNARNCFQDGNGNLVLRVSPGTMGRPYDFARLQTFQEGGWPPPRVLWAHGPGVRMEARIKFGAGAGVWGGFWPMGTNAATPLEIDVQEFRGAVPTQVAIHPHGPVNGSLPVYDTKVNLADGFHVYWIEYRDAATTFGYDATIVGSLPTPPQSLGLRFSNAVGVPGSWGGQAGPPPASSVPSDMLVDYVRVWAL